MSVQRVVVRRSGGFAGLTTTAEIDDPAEAERLTAAVQNAAAASPGRARDGYVYEITIVTTTTTDRVVLTAAQAPPELRTLPF